MAKRNTLRLNGSKTVQRISIVEYQVVPNGERWDVERDDSFTGSFAYDLHTAIGLATAAALGDVHNGTEATVCVQKQDGSCRHVWP